MNVNSISRSKQNKKQRLAVRQSVIKQKDPHQILAELERLDDIGEFEFFCVI